MLPLVGGKEHSQVAYLLERLSTVILTISPNRFSFCQAITISSWVHVDQLNYRDVPSKGSFIGECHNQIIVCSIKRSLIALLPFGREEKSHSKVAGCDQRGKFQWFPQDAESSSTVYMYHVLNTNCFCQKLLIIWAEIGDGILMQTRLTVYNIDNCIPKFHKYACLWPT